MERFLKVNLLFISRSLINYDSFQFATHAHACIFRK